MIKKYLGIQAECGKSLDNYHSVEFYIDGMDIPYQFRIWDMASESINVLIRDDSGVLPLIKEGDILDMKYYSNGSVYPSEKIPTAIRHVTRKKQGRFKGHHLVGLEII